MLCNSRPERRSSAHTSAPDALGTYTHSGPDGDGPGLLTRRQREVAALVARGLTNREIADRLVVTERTVENHVADIMDRLGSRSRAVIGTWAAQHGLLAGGDVPHDTD